MTPEQINIAIAKYCGWRIGDDVPELLARGIEPLGPPLPDYCSDLKAMREAEALITNLEPAYTDELARITNAGHLVPLFPVAHASAAERAEAFLRATGNWNE